MAPEPFTSPDSDLRDFEYMPLMVDQLRHSKSWLMAKRNPEVGFYMMNLWTAAWHTRPAGSLENDDDVLADMAMCQIEKWLEVKEAVLRGWTECSDGRLYHRVVADRVNEAWGTRQAYRERLAKARAAKAQRRPKVEPTLEHRLDMAPEAEKPQLHVNNSSIIEQSQVYPQLLREKVEKERIEYPPTPLAGGTKAKRLGKGRARIEVDWQPNENGIDFAKSRSAPHDEAAVAAFRDHHLAKGSLMADWSAAWRTWCNNAERFGRTEPSLFQADTDDPWGINAWIARQPDVVDDPVGIGTPENPKPCKTINKWAVVAHAEAVAEAAGLPMTWRGNWDHLGLWFREDQPLNDRGVLAAISSRAQWFRKKGGPINAIKSFDSCVRENTRCRPAGGG